MKNPNQPPLFQDLADVEQARGFKTRDEREFEKSQKRKAKRKNTPMPKAPATGPACLRCLRWRKWMGDSELGTCSVLVRIGKRYSHLDLDVGTVIHINEADRMLVDDWEHLRTGEAFSCRSFADVADMEAA